MSDDEAFGEDDNEAVRQESAKPSTTQERQPSKRRESLKEELQQRRLSSKRNSTKQPHRGSTGRGARGSTGSVFVDRAEQDASDIPVQRRRVFGLLIDFLIRLKPSTDEMHPHEHVNRILGVKQQEGTQQWAGYLNAIEAVNHEMLYSAIMEDVIIFWKGVGNAEWHSDGQLFRAQAKEVYRIKQQVLCVRNEVKNWLMQLSLRTIKYNTPEQGNQKDRHQRHQEFWAQFHEVPRKLEIGQVSPGSPRCQTPKSQRSRTRTPLPRGKGLDVKSRSEQDLQWKDRPARSRCSAGNWDWSRGTQKKKGILDPANSALWKFDEMPDFYSDSGDASSKSMPLKANHRWWQAHQAVPDAVSPFVNRSAGFSVSPNIAMSKSASLPCLPGRRSPRQQQRRDGAHSHSRASHELELPEVDRVASLPPISSAYVVPWQGKSPVPTLRCEETPTKRYLCSTQLEGSLPRPIPFITGHSLRLTAGGQSLCDKDLVAVVDMMPSVEIEEVDLEGNLLLSEKALLKLMAVLQASPAAESLHRLSLKRCSSAGQKVLDMVIGMMVDLNLGDGRWQGCYNLQVLNLSGIAIGSRRHLPLAKAVGGHPSLTKVMLADTSLGESPHPELCVENITGSRTITSLDLGWNCLGEEVFALVGQRLIERGVLKELVLANCSASGTHGHASPIVFFIEHLSRSRSLKRLDISLNRIDFRAALVVEDALEICKTLNTLQMSHNPLGFLGLRCLLRLMSRETSGLQHFSFNDCSTGKASDQDELYQVFSCTNPGGRYVLDLARPYHRSILRMLYKTCERYNLSHDAAFSHITAKPAYAHPSKDGGIWQVPSSGSLALTFSVDKAVEDAIGHVNEWDFSDIIDRYLCMTRLQPSFHKVVPLLAMWKSIDGRMNDQRTFLNALSKDFFLQYPHIEQMTSNRGMTVDILGQLMHCIKGGQVTRFLAMLLVPSLGDYLGLMKKQKTLFTFNVDNPNGHYKLDLDSVGDYAVAERLLLLDRWETRIAQFLGRVDTSQRGNHSQIRNERYQQRPILAASCQEWNMPEEAEFEFDYSSGKRPPADATPIDQVTFASILVTLQSSDCQPYDQLHALQMVADKIYLKAVQMRALLGIYATEEMRADLFVLFFLRVVDFYNEKLYRVRFEHQYELDRLAHRLGYVTLFPFVQPEQTKFVFDLSIYEQRMGANILLNLRAKENPLNLKDKKYIREDGSIDPLPTDIPPTWQTFNKMPTSGKLHVSYACAPEDRNYKARRAFYETYGYRSGVAEDDVMWWAALNESPEDVLEYLAFLVSKYGNPTDAFVVIDGVDGNGVLSLREFEDAYKEMGCEKFKTSPDLKKSEEEAKRLEIQRVHSVFRWLDPSGEGQVSKGEWNILELLWSEIKLSITEFIQFCERTFGDELAEAWKFLDEDGGGEIDMEEWCKACEECGFFGPVIPIFRFLDADDEGTISLDEFNQLEKFQAERENRHNAKVERMRAKEAAGYNAPTISRPASRHPT